MNDWEIVEEGNKLIAKFLELYASKDIKFSGNRFIWHYKHGGKFWNGDIDFHSHWGKLKEVEALMLIKGFGFFITPWIIEVNGLYNREGTNPVIGRLLVNYKLDFTQTQQRNYWNAIVLFMQVYFKEL